MLFTWNTTSSSERFDFFISSLQVDIICETEQLLNRKLGDILQSTLMESISVKDTFFNNNLFIGTNIHCKVNYSSHPVDPQQQQLLSYPLDATFHPLNNWGQVNNASMDTQQFMEKIWCNNHLFIHKLPFRRVTKQSKPQNSKKRKNCCVFSRSPMEKHEKC